MRKRPIFCTFLLQVCWQIGGAQLAQGAAAGALRLPDEIEAAGGQGTAQGHTGAAALSDTAAIRINPAMLYQHRNYDVAAGYYWPAVGRPFYKAGVIDGVTSQMVAGFEYTGFQEALKPEAERREPDSPVHKRASVALAIPAQYFALGLAAYYVEGEDPDALPGESKPLKGISLGAGLVIPVMDRLRIGLSYENINNRRVAALSPAVSRAGIAWEDQTNTIQLSADYRQRQRSLTLESTPPELTLIAEEPVRDPERMGFVGMQTRTFNFVRVFASYGKTVAGPERAIASGGVGIYQKNFSFAYAVSKNFPTQDELQSSLQLSMIMKM